MLTSESNADYIGASPAYLEDAFSVSSRSFLNSLLKEWHGWSILRAIEVGLPPDPATRDVLVIPLPGAGARVLVPIIRRSSVGHPAFGAMLYEAGPGAARRAIAFPDVVTRLLGEPSIVGRVKRDNGLVFLRRVLDSVATIADVLARPRPLAKPDAYIAAEQGLRFGHSVHPAPRSRDEFTRADSRLYGPEHGGGFQLRWWHVAPEIVAHDSARSLAVPDMAAGLLAADPLGEARLQPRNGRILVPVHPWQAARLLNHPAIVAQAQAGLIADLGPAGSPWFATSSLRTVHAAHADWMLKFSLSLRLTNSKRIVEPYECERGKEVDRILASDIGAAFRARFPSFRIMGEPAHLSLRDPAGAILPETIMVFRDNPFQGENQSDAAVLATLCEIDPDGFGSPLGRIVTGRAAADGTSVAGAASRWFGLFLDHAVAPCLVAQADYGLLFGAHQQNLVVALDDGWPAGAYFRDCQGTGYVRPFVPWLAGEVDGIAGASAHVFDAPEAARLVGYYLVSNSVFGTIAALSAGGGDEAALLRQLRAFLERLASAGPRDPTCLDYLLGAPTISSKGNFMIAFRNINENTDVVDPLAGYVEQPNPIAAVRS